MSNIEDENIEEYDLNLFSNENNTNQLANLNKKDRLQFYEKKLKDMTKRLDIIHSKIHLSNVMFYNDLYLEVFNDKKASLNQLVT